MRAILELGPAAPCPDGFNLAAHVLARAAERPEKIALLIVSPTGAERWSYARLESAVRGTAGGLLSLGLRPGDRVLMRLANTVEFPILYLGAIAAGIVPVPTSSQLTAAEITRIAGEIRPALIAAAAGVALPDAPGVPVLDEGALAALHGHAPADYDLGDPDRLAYVIYTSGTSGNPRAVMHAHRAIWARRMMWDGWYGLREDDRLLHAGAFNWTYTLGTGLMDPWAIGATALIPAAGTAAEALPLLMKRHDATIFAAAPGVYRQMLRGPGPFRLPRLRHGLSAGERMPDTIRAAWTKATGTGVHEAFGMSECSTFISSCPSHPAPEGATGHPQPGRHVAILRPDGMPAERGEPGVIAVHRDDPGLFLGYLGAEEETKARFSGDWFLTGDSGVMAGDGAITYLGRDDDMMNAGGYRVSPLEVEAAVNTHPMVHESAAAEVAVGREASVIAVFYVPEPGAQLTEADLAAHAAARLARYKQPRIWIAVQTLPRGANGKLQRRALRQEWEARNGAA